MIELDGYEKKLILLCKGQLVENYPFTGKWVTTIKPLFIETYGWNPDESNDYYNQYLYVIFSKLLDVHLKIKEDLSGTNQQIKEIFNSILFKKISNDAELPIERAIHTLCGLISSTKILDDNGNKRYDLNLEK